MGDDLPGFIEDDPKPTAKKPAPPAPPAAAFNPFAEVKVSLDPTAASGSAPEPKPAVGGGGKAAGGKAGAAPGTGRVAKPASPPPDDGDAGIAPGQGRDLWLCPHCNAKNKPGRETCRSCGKSPQDEVEQPWHAKPAARIGIAAGALVLVVVIALALMGGGDVQLAPADAAHADKKPRFGKRVEGSTDLGGGRRFVAERRVALCGRVLLSQAGPAGTTEVALALGDSARDDAAFNALTVEASGFEVTVRPEPLMRIVDLLASDDHAVPKVARGEWLSVVGATGVIEQDGQRSREIGDDDLVVRVEQSTP